MNAVELVRALGARVGITDLSLGAEGACSVIFDQDEVIFEENTGRLFVFAEIGSAAGRTDVYTVLLDANHLGHGSGFGSIGLDKERETFTLSRVVETPCEYEQFEEQLKLFVSVLRYWKKYLQEGPQEQSDNQTLPPNATVV